MSDPVLSDLRRRVATLVGADQRGMWSNLEIAGLHAAIDLENRTQAMTTTTSDSTEARRAWLDRRPPRFDLR